MPPSVGRFPKTRLELSSRAVKGNYVSLLDRPPEADHNFDSKIRSRALQICLLLIALGFALHALDLVTPEAGTSPQSNRMVNQSRTLEQALTPGLWPTGYPLTLWGFGQLGVEPQALNKGLLILSIVLLAVLARAAGFSTWVVPASAYAFLAAPAFNLALFTSEAALVPCSLVLLLLLHRYGRRPNTITLCLIGALLAYAANLRYFALVWLFPIAIVHISCAQANSHLRRIGRVFGLLCLALPTIIATLAINFFRTGYATGLDRFDWSIRRLNPAADGWKEQTDFISNISLTFKTWLIDWFSATRFADHSTLDEALWPNLGAIGAIGVAMLALGLGLSWRIRKPNTVPVLVAVRNQFAKPDLTFLVGESLALFLLTTIILWTVGNNDPIYTRFIFPAYAPMIFLICSIFEKAKKPSSVRLVWLTCAALLLFIQVTKVGLL